MGNKIMTALLVALLLLPCLTFSHVTNADSDDYVLLIITPAAFEDELQRLKDWKDATGRPTLIATLEDIYADNAGYDQAGDIKLAIHGYKQDYPTINYVMLVGDVDTLPVRYFYINETDATQLKWLKFYMTDHYYADLYNDDGSYNDWDADDNGLYGQTPLIENVYENHDDLDFHLDVAVGRVPASSAGEVKNYVDKVINYEGQYSRDEDWFRDVLLLTGAGADRYEPPTDIDQNEDIADLLGPSYDFIRLYDESGYDDYPDPGSINDAINDGVGFVNVVCHANRALWGGVYDVRYDMGPLDNGDMLPVIWSFGCSSASYGPLPPEDHYRDIWGTAQTSGFTLPQPLPYTEPERPSVLQVGFDLESMPEYWLVFENDSGAIAFLGSTAEAVAGPGYAMNYDFFDTFNDGVWTLGDAWLGMGEKYLADHNLESGDRGEWENCRRWLFMNLFGDPSLVIGGLPNTPPAADAGPDQTVEQTSPAGAWVGLDGTGSMDDGAIAPLTYSWAWSSGSASGATPTVFLPPGDTIVTLEVSDGEFTDTDTVTITVEDTTPPAAHAGPDQTLEQASHAGTSVTLSGSATDACDPSPALVWKEGSTTLGTGITLVHTFNLGTHTVTLEATDDSDNTGTDTVVIRIVDTTPPDVDAGEDVTAEQESHDGTEVTLTGTVYDICDPDPAVEWSEDGTALGSGTTITHTFNLGIHEVTLSATDVSGNTATDTIVVTIEDTMPPTANAGDDVRVEQESYDGTEVTLHGSATDICDSSPDLYWYEGATLLGTGAELTATFNWGTHTVTLSAVDNAGNVGSDTVVVEVVDTTPPVITAVATPGILWSPNHKYRNIFVTVEVTDICDPSPTFALVSATSNEPDDAIGWGDGNTINDIVIIDDTHLKLRAERSGSGTGRLYTMTYLATDRAGNTALATAEVLVPNGWF